MPKVNDSIFFFQDNQLKKGKLIALEEDYTPLGVMEYYVLDLAGKEHRVLKPYCFRNRAEVLEYIAEMTTILQ